MDIQQLNQGNIADRVRKDAIPPPRPSSWIRRKTSDKCPNFTRIAHSIGIAEPIGTAADAISGAFTSLYDLVSQSGSPLQQTTTLKPGNRAKDGTIYTDSHLSYLLIHHSLTRKQILSGEVSPPDGWERGYLHSRERTPWAPVPGVQYPPNK